MIFWQLLTQIRLYDENFMMSASENFTTCKNERALSVTLERKK